MGGRFLSSLAPVTQTSWDHLDVLSSQLSIFVMGIFQTTASVVPSGLTKRIKRSSVQCCILIVTLAGNTCGGNLSIICSTSHVSPEPCLPSCGKAEKAPVMMEELEGAPSQFSMFFIYLCCLLGSIKRPGSRRIKVSIQLQVKGWPKSVVRPQGKKRGCCMEGSTQEGTAWWLTSQGSFGLRLGWQGGLIQHLSLRVSS